MFKYFTCFIFLGTLTLTTTGCNDLCASGIQLKTRLQNLQTEVGGALLSPSLLTQNCQDFRAHWLKYLTTASRYATRVAQTKFTSNSSPAQPLDGYDEATELASLLSSSEAQLAAACADHDANADVEALVKLVEVKNQAATAADDLDYVLPRAGCVNSTIRK